MAKVQVKFDEAGNAYVETPDNANAAEMQRLAILEHALVQQQMKSEQTRTIAAILEKNPEYETANKKYREAMKWLNGRIIEEQEKHGIEGQLPADAALDFIDEYTNLESEFNKKYPNIEIDTAIKGVSSKRSYEKSLQAFIDQKEDQKVTRKVNTETLVKTGMGADFVLGASDDDVAALEAYMRESEKSGII